MQSLLRCRTEPQACTHIIHGRQAQRVAFRSLSTRHDDKSAPIPIFRDVAALREARRPYFRSGESVGFVPTMGALHEGHLSLVRYALNENDRVFVSVFVNPTQFGVNEDLASYPKTWQEDLRMLKETEGRSGKSGSITGIFAPSVKVMYPTLPPSSEVDGDGSFVTITPLGKWLEGASRPVFFRGVATVCTKLFNIVQPDRVYFGQKDGQQSVLMRKMVKDFHIPTEVRVIPTSREADGLAMSSRNLYLGERRRQDVIVLSKALFASQAAFERGERSVKKIRQVAVDCFHRDVGRENGSLGKSCRLDIDYIALNRADDMDTIDDAWDLDPSEGAILSAAMKVWPVDDPQNEQERQQLSVRLIDNVILEPQGRGRSIDVPQ